MADSGESPSPDTKQSKTEVGGSNQRSYKENNMSRKGVFSKETGGTTALKSLPTPINLFEDECVFCHSFRTSQVIQIESIFHTYIYHDRADVLKVTHGVLISVSWADGTLSEGKSCVH